MRYCFLIIALALAACNQPQPKVSQKKETVKKDTAALNRAAKRPKAISADQLDSLKDETFVTEVINYIKRHPADNVGKKIYPVPDSSGWARIRIGNFFSGKIKHAIIRTQRDWRMIVYIYRLDNYNRVLRENVQDWSEENYFGDKVRDINGDGVKDFMINWYPSSGCCRRNAYYVYLYQTNDTFTSRFDIVNPTFYPASKLIRGVSYGHSGEVPLYKYKWNGFRLDTVEYIYPADTLKHKFYKVNGYEKLHDPLKREVITKVPAEYRHIESFDWFMDY